MTFTTKQIKHVLKKILKFVLVTAFWLLVWEAASRLLSRDNELLLLILPSPVTVFKTWLNMGFTPEYLTAALYTLLRVFLGFLIGSVVGILIGIVTNLSKIADAIISPILKLIRAVPVVAIVILLYLFFKSDVLPIIIVILMVLPLVWQTVYDGLCHTDRQYLEMAKVYKLSRFKTFMQVRLPLIVPSLISTLINALGLAWKSGVAAEVICLPAISLGTILWSAKGGVDFDKVYAVTLTVVILSIIIEILLKQLTKRLLKGRIENEY